MIHHLRNTFLSSSLQVSFVAAATHHQNRRQRRQSPTPPAITVSVAVRDRLVDLKLDLIFVPDRGLLKITEEEFSGPPYNVVIELFVGLLLCFWVVLTVPGSLNPFTLTPRRTGN
ncbi:hypothetical protein DEO72_LG6g429 [Vigna unguiculata]|uniref:Uncharacterized protein n=1 Tax=Vigna unguiculata TaxID=3917 RepID=A0A4D6M6X7_VIGUN|nr:hypothetical protein DEO72_LG6g429 [Vigna unguiculata]